MNATTTSAADFTMPGEYGRRLYNAYGADRAIPPTPAWVVVNDEVRRVAVTSLRSASGCGEQADYAGLKDGGTAATFYLFPVAKHCRPTLETIKDDFGTTRQWVARVKSRCRQRWE